MPDLSVIIVSHNTRALLARCLASLEAAAAAAALATEIIVVDNASSDGSVELLARHFPRARVLANRANLGFAAANNRGLAEVHAGVALLLNSDAFVTAGALRGALDTLRTTPRAGLVGLRIVNEDGSAQAADGRFPTLWADIRTSAGLDRRPRRDGPAATGVRPTDWVHGACMFVRTAAVRQVGPLDERFFMYSEEVDWCRRFRAAGWEVWYRGDLAVVHLGGASHTDDLRRRAALYRGRLGLRRRLGGPLASLILWCCMIASLGARTLGKAAARTLLRRRLGRQSAAGDWDLARAVMRMDPLARWIAP